jgi:hypothetical protein
VVKGAVQETLPPQHVSPALPQAPPWQPPAVQTPWPAEQAPPATTHVFVLWSQQPPVEQSLPSQQGCPVPPQVTHLEVAALHVSPEAVQKLAATLLPLVLPVQHACP